MSPFPPHVQDRAAEYGTALEALAGPLADAVEARDALLRALGDGPFDLRPGETVHAPHHFVRGLHAAFLGGGPSADRAADRLAILAGHLVPHEPASADPAHGSNRAT